MKEQKWISEACAVDMGLIKRTFGLVDWGTRFGAHAVNQELRLIRVK